MVCQMHSACVFTLPEESQGCQNALEMLRRPSEWGPQVKIKNWWKRYTVMIIYNEHSNLPKLHYILHYVLHFAEGGGRVTFLCEGRSADVCSDSKSKLTN